MYFSIIIVVVLLYLFFLFLLFYGRYFCAFVNASPRNIYTYNKEVLIPVILPIKNEEVSLFEKFVKNWSFTDKRFLLVIIDDSTESYFNDYINILIKNTNTYPKKEYINNSQILHIKNVLYIKRHIKRSGKGTAINFAIDVLKKLNYKFEAFATYDIEWRVDFTNILKGYNIIHNSKNIAFVQFRRKTINPSLFAMFSDLFFDFIQTAREVLNEPVMYAGSCALINYSIFQKLGGFKDHIVEDAEFTVRCYLSNFKGKYLYEIVDYGENLPGDFNAAINTFYRWIYGGLLLSFQYSIPIINSKLSVKEKLSLVYMLNCGFSYMFTVTLSLVNVFLSIYPLPISISYLEYFLISFLPLTHLILSFTIYYIIIKKLQYKINPFVIYIFGWGIDILFFAALIKVVLRLPEKRRVTKKVGKEKVRVYFLFIYLFFFIILSYNILLFVEYQAIIGLIIYTIWLLSCILFILYMISPRIYMMTASQSEKMKITASAEENKL